MDLDKLITLVIWIPIFIVAKCVQYFAYIGILVVLWCFYKGFADDGSVLGQLICIWGFIVVGLLTIASFCKKK